MGDTLTERLVSALTEARYLIGAYHGEPGWVEYQQSPEMKRINGVLDEWARAPIHVALDGSREDAPPEFTYGELRRIVQQARDPVKPENVLYEVQAVIRRVWRERVRVARAQEGGVTRRDD